MKRPGLREVHTLPRSGKGRQACDASPDLSAENAEAPKPEPQEISPALQFYMRMRRTLKSPPQENPTGPGTEPQFQAFIHKELSQKEHDPREPKFKSNDL